MTTPRLGAPELSTSQTGKEETVNEQIRYIEAGAGHFIFKDRDLATPPGSPADGDCYLVAASPTGAWAGMAGKIAFRLNTSWIFITVVEGFTAWVNDEDVFIGYNGSAWTSFGGANFMAPEWVPNFTSDGSALIYASVAMTVTQQATSGTGAVAYEKSTTAAPSTFTSTTSPISLQAGAWLKVIATGVSGTYAIALKRTA